ncbi:MAG: TetR family transcriptional regulator [Rhodoglobus sp.]
MRNIVPAQNTEPPHESQAALRNEPVQARSAARLTALLDAAAAVIDEIGFERLTTAMVAERAGASIGTVYRYFPDRIAVLQALASRNLQRVTLRLAEEIHDEKHGTAHTAAQAALGALIEAFRSEPGFRGLRVGDVLDLHPPLNERTFNSIISDRIVEELVARFGCSDTPEIRLTFETAIEISDALVARAFARKPRGDEAFLGASREIVSPLLARALGSTE